MFAESEQLMSNMLNKALNNKRVAQAKETAKEVSKQSPIIVLEIILNMLKAITYAPIAILIWPFVNAFKKPNKRTFLK